MLYPKKGGRPLEAGGVGFQGDVRGSFPKVRLAPVKMQDTARLKMD